MKIVKLGLIFAAIVAALILIVNWESVFGSETSDMDFPEEDQRDVSQRCDRIRSMWRENNMWNQELYDKQRAELRQDSVQHYFSQVSYNTIRTCIRECAADNVYKSYKSSIKPDAYSHTNVLANYKGVEHLKRNELNMVGDQRIKELGDIHSLYNRVYSFSRNELHPIRPEFNADELTWISFDAQKNGIMSTARSYRGNVKFAEIKDLPGFQRALEESYLESVINPQRSKFYKDLSEQICKHFSPMEANEENLKKINDVFKKFVGEANDVGVMALAQVITDMKNKLPKEN